MLQKGKNLLVSMLILSSISSGCFSSNLSDNDKFDVKFIEVWSNVSAEQPTNVESQWTDHCQSYLDYRDGELFSNDYIPRDTKIVLITWTELTENVSRTIGRPMGGPRDFSTTNESQINLQSLLLDTPRLGEFNVMENVVFYNGEQMDEGVILYSNISYNLNNIRFTERLTILNHETVTVNELGPEYCV